MLKNKKELVFYEPSFQVVYLKCYLNIHFIKNTVWNTFNDQHDVSPEKR